MICLHTTLGALKKEKYNRGRAFKTNLIKHTLSAIERSLPFEPKSQYCFKKLFLK